MEVPIFFWLQWKPSAAHQGWWARPFIPLASTDLSWKMGPTRVAVSQCCCEDSSRESPKLKIELWHQLQGMFDNLLSPFSLSHKNSSLQLGTLSSLPCSYVLSWDKFCQ